MRRAEDNGALRKKDNYGKAPAIGGEPSSDGTDAPDPPTPAKQGVSKLHEAGERVRGREADHEAGHRVHEGPDAAADWVRHPAERVLLHGARAAFPGVEHLQPPKPETRLRLATVGQREIKLVVGHGAATVV